MQFNLARHLVEASITIHLPISGMGLLAILQIGNTQFCTNGRYRGGGDQAYSRLSTTHGHITDCKLDSVVYAGVCVVS